MNLSGNAFDFLIVFLGGIFVSFTPCVFPLLPITISYIGVEAGSSKRKALTLSLFYVLGLSITYSLLGLVASLTGTIFGRISSNPLTYIFVGIVILIFGLAMLDLFQLPMFRLMKMSGRKEKNTLGAFLLGLSSGLVASPCLTPVLGTILAYLTIKKSLVYGSLLLFVFALGMGTSLVIAGLFSSALMSMPKLGKWMDYIKKILAAVMFVLGLYFIFIGIRRML